MISKTYRQRRKEGQQDQKAISCWKTVTTSKPSSASWNDKACSISYYTTLIYSKPMKIEDLITSLFVTNQLPRKGVCLSVWSATLGSGKDIFFSESWETDYYFFKGGPGGWVTFWGMNILSHLQVVDYILVANCFCEYFHSPTQDLDGKKQLFVVFSSFCCAGVFFFTEIT